MLAMTTRGRCDNMCALCQYHKYPVKLYWFCQAWLVNMLQRVTPACDLCLRSHASLIGIHHCCRNTGPCSFTILSNGITLNIHHMSSTLMTVQFYAVNWTSVNTVTRPKYVIIDSKLSKFW